MSTPAVHVHPAGVGLFVHGVARLSGVAAMVGRTDDGAGAATPEILGAAVSTRRQLLDGDHPHRDVIRADVTVLEMWALRPFAERGEL